MEFLKHVTSNKYVISSLIAFFVFLVLNIFSGLIGNSAYTGALPSWLREALKNLKIFLAFHLLNITSFFSLVSLLIIIILVFRNRIINEALNLTDSLAKSDDSLLRLLTNSIVDMHSKDIEEL